MNVNIGIITIVIISFIMVIIISIILIINRSILISSLRAFRRARDGEAQRRVDWQRRR